MKQNSFQKKQAKKHSIKKEPVDRPFTLKDFEDKSFFPETPESFHQELRFKLENDSNYDPDEGRPFSSEDFEDKSFFPQRN